MSVQLSHLLPQIHVRETGGEKSHFVHRSAKARKIPQETVRQIRADWMASMKLRAIAAKHAVGESYVRRLIHDGLRDDEREFFLRRKAR